MRYSSYYAFHSMIGKNRSKVGVNSLRKWFYFDPLAYNLLMGNAE